MTVHSRERTPLKKKKTERKNERRKHTKHSTTTPGLMVGSATICTNSYLPEEGSLDSSMSDAVDSGHCAVGLTSIVNIKYVCEWPVAVLCWTVPNAVVA